ncbi:MAG: hypothetical protein IT448_00075 [Phycisphaerales bacterium]|nr:hypothetical protein [Phycisphaerales bacterium]
MSIAIQEKGFDHHHAAEIAHRRQKRREGSRRIMQNQTNTTVAEGVHVLAVRVLHLVDELILGVLSIFFSSLR